MTFLKGRIRGPSKTQLGTALGTTRGQALNASDKQFTTGGTQELSATITEIMQKDMDGEKILFPYARVRLNTGPGRYVDWPYWFRIANPPDEIDTLYGSLKNVSEEKPMVKVRFTSQTRRSGFVTLGSSSADVDDYGGGEVKEYDGIQIV